MTAIEKQQVVYVMYNPVTKLTKIGITRDIKKRLYTLSCANGVQLELYFYTHPCMNAERIERNMHIHFAEHRKLGEWFKHDKKLIKIELLQQKLSYSKLVKDYLNDISVNEIAISYKVSRQAIEKKLHELGINRKHINKEPKIIKNVIIEPIIEIPIIIDNSIISNDKIIAMVKANEEKMKLKKANKINLNSINRVI